MSEPILKALIQLFALVSDIHDDTVITSREKEVVRSFLARHLNNELVVKYMKMFDEYLGIYNSERIAKGSKQDRKRTSLNAMRILAICDNINQELQQKQKIYVLVKLIDYISSGEEVTENISDFLQTVSNAFFIDEEEFRNIKSFIMEDAVNIPDKDKILVIKNSKDTRLPDVKHLYNDGLKGTIIFFHIAGTNTYIMRYSGNEDLYLNGQNISTAETYIFDSGSSIRGSGINAVYYTEVVSIISQASIETGISLDAFDVSFKFRKSENGIHNLNFHEETGKLVGILGGSGVGKSTTLSILNGTLKPQNGNVYINGYDLYDKTDKEFLKGVIGNIPQDDLLIEDLTVWQNLYHNARMCLNNFSEEMISERVDRILNDLDLSETKDLKVGDPLKKIISGGQRKRVNIALELIREPTILFVDEPTSGLSSVDSEIVMNLLKELTYKGKLVIVNIHQPGSELYKMFDRIMIIDKGGYQIYYGNPTEAIVYFKIHSNHANPYEDQCAKCGNINTEQLLQIVEARVMNEHGKATRVRKVTPREWAEKFRETSGDNNKIHIGRKEIPENYYSIPGLIKQSWIFFIRGLLSKLADKQYLLISLLGSPLLALLLAFFTRYAKTSSYSFSSNENIPAYLFMCVVTSLFFGLMISSEEIVRDRKILKRESFLNLSWFSYLNSKILILFILSAIQTISFVIIGNLILDIKGMTTAYWIVLFTTSCTANILGLNLSSAFNSVISIYILIPFILIPQLLFSGVLVRYDKLHVGSNSSREFVPVIGDLMTARWSFEALAVEQFKNNKYEKPYFNNNVKISQNNWYASFLIPNLQYDLSVCKKYNDSILYRDEVLNNYAKLDTYTEKLSELAGFNYPDLLKTSFSSHKLDSTIYRQVSLYLDSLKHKFNFLMTSARKQNDTLRSITISKSGIKEYINQQNNYENERLKVIVTAEDNPVKIIETDNKIIQSFEPVYMKPASKSGNAHYYAPVKILGHREFDTFWFNISVIWIVSIILYVALYFNLLRKVIEFLGNLRLQKSET